jgi:hypothetical protein
MNRFNSAEDIEFHPEGLSQGRLARLGGHRMEKANPYELGSWLWQSFNAGWADVDMDENAPKEEIYG